MVDKSKSAQGAAAKDARGTASGRPDDVERGLATKQPPKSSAPTAAAPAAATAAAPPVAVAESPEQVAGMGLFVYNLAKPGVPEATRICATPKDPLWQKAQWVGSIDDILKAAKDQQAKLARLGILCHEGDGGAGSLRIGNDQVTPLTVNYLKGLEAVLSPQATVYFFGCVAGKSKDGSFFLKELSKILPGRTLIGFSTFTQVDSRTSHKEGATWYSSGRVCYEPVLWTTESIEGRTGLPLTPTTALSPEAKHAKDGRIIRWPKWESADKDDATFEERKRFWVRFLPPSTP